MLVANRSTAAIVNNGAKREGVHTGVGVRTSAYPRLHTPVNYQPVETDGAARAAKEIIPVMKKRAWANG